MTDQLHELSLAIRELWSYFAHWRFGKLMDNLAIWAYGPNCAGIETVPNDDLLQAALEQINKLIANKMEPQPLNLVQHQMLLAFERFMLARSLLSIGEGMQEIAGQANKRVYDLEDAEVFEAAKKLRSAVVAS